METRYYIYEIPGVKIGCTLNHEFKYRQRAQKHLGEMIIIEEHIDISTASKRELELQKIKGYPVDNHSYEYWTKVISAKSRTPKLNKQRGEKLSKKYKGNPRNLLDKNVRTKIPYDKLGKLTSTRQKGKPQPQLHTAEAREKKRLKLQKEVFQYTKDGLFLKSYNSAKEASQLTGIHRTSIGANARKKIPSAGGYVWSYFMK